MQSNTRSDQMRAGGTALLDRPRRWHPTTGNATFTRNGKTFTTRPWGSRLRHPQPPDQPQPDA